MLRNLQIVLLMTIVLFCVSCGDSGTDSEEPIPHDFTTAPSEELSQIIEETPSDFTWDFFNDNIEITLHDDPQWSGSLVISGFQVQNGDVVNTMTSEAVQTNVDELVNGLSTEEMFPESNWIPGSDWVSAEEMIPSTNWFPGEMWTPSEMQEVALSQNDLSENQTMVVVYAHVPLESVEREQVTRPYGIIFQQQSTIGSIEVTTNTNNGSGNSYMLFVDGANDTQMSANDNITISGLSDGSHQAELDQVPSSCSISGNNPRSVTVTAGQTTTTTFDISCQTSSGNKIAFTSLRDGNTEIYTMDADGSNQQRLTNNSVVDYAPVISNDGSKIAFYSGRGSETALHVMDLNGQNVTEITTALGDPGFISWSPDDSQIVFSSYEAESREVVKVNVNDGSQTLLTDNSDDDGFPNWSPDGDEIVFVSDRNGGEFELFSMDTDGNDVQQITTSASLDGYAPHPRWSPDGARLLVNGLSGAIYTMDPDGSNVEEVTGTSESDNFPAWSADGTEIVFSRDNNIYKINADGSGSATSLTNTTDRDFEPYWTPVE